MDIWNLGQIEQWIRSSTTHTHLLHWPLNLIPGQYTTLLLITVIYFCWDKNVSYHFLSNFYLKGQFLENKNDTNFFFKNFPNAVPVKWSVDDSTYYKWNKLQKKVNYKNVKDISMLFTDLYTYNGTKSWFFNTISNKHHHLAK